MGKSLGEDELELRVTIEDAAPDEEPEGPSVEEGRLRKVEEGRERLLGAVDVGAIRGPGVAAVNADREVEVRSDGPELVVVGRVVAREPRFEWRDEQAPAQAPELASELARS